MAESSADGVFLWAASGAMALTGPADGPPAVSPGAPALAAAEAIATLAPSGRPGVGVLAERAALAGYTRRAPLSVGGAFRAVPARDGWLGLSLARQADVELVPALIGAEVAHDPWESLARWAAREPVDIAVARARLLGLPACAVATEPAAPTRAPVEITVGGSRVPTAHPLVVDLTSLWAGPLCAHLLGLAGARVVKVESSHRPDGARAGPAAFFDLLHAGHESVVVDFARPARLRTLLDAADVVLEGSRPRALRQLGVEAHDYVARGTIWMSITAYGRVGPAPNWVGFGDDVAAAAGLVASCGGVPYPVGDAIADPLAGLFAAAAVTDALRGETGALLDVSMYDVALHAARLPSPAGVAVIDDAALGWCVRVDERIQPVLAPQARRPTGSAPALGAHTRAVLAELDGISDR